MNTMSFPKRFPQSLLIVLCGAATFHTQAATVAHYRFEEGPAESHVLVITDSGPNGINGNVEGSSPLHFTSKVAPYPETGQGALRADGDFNFGRIPHHPAFESLGSFTIEFFVRTSKNHENYGGVGPHLRHTILGKKMSTEEGAENTFSFAYEPLRGRVVLTARADPREMGSGVDLRDGRWHHVAWMVSRTESGYSSGFYMDGECSSFSASSSPMNFDWGTGPWCIGADNFANDAQRGNFDGEIDEIRVSDVPLGPADFVTDLSRKPLAATITAKVEIAWPSSRHRLYQVEWASKLDPDAWHNLGGPFYGNGFTNVVYDDVANWTARFYRVQAVE